LSSKHIDMHHSEGYLLLCITVFRWKHASMRSKESKPLSGQQRGGLARKERLSSARRSEIASRAAQARWQRDPEDLKSSEIEDLQMNTDTIDAADILVTELNEQVV